MECSQSDKVLIEFKHRTLALDTTVGLFVCLVYIGVEPACTCLGYGTGRMHQMLLGASVPLPREGVK